MKIIRGHGTSSISHFLLAPFPSFVDIFWRTVLTCGLLSAIVIAVDTSDNTNDGPTGKLAVVEHPLNATVNKKDVVLYECPEEDESVNKIVDQLQNDLNKVKIAQENLLQASRTHAGFLETLNDVTTDLVISGAKPESESNIDDYEIPSEEIFEMESSSQSPQQSMWEPDAELLGEGANFRKFSLVSATKCSQGRIKKFNWHPAWMNAPSHHSSEITLSNMSIIEDGKLVWNKRDSERHVYGREDYCISRYDEGGWVSFKVCTPDCSDVQRPCVRKCCPPSKIIHGDTRGCVSAVHPWRPLLDRSPSESQEDNATNPWITFGFPDCSIKYLLDASPNFKFLLDGTVVQINGAKRTYINSGEYCIDGIFYNETKDGRGFGTKLENADGVIYTRIEWEQTVIACQPTPTEKDKIDAWRVPLYAFLHTISAFCLLITACVYVLLWKHQWLHGWLQFAYVCSLFCTFTCLAILQIWSSELMERVPKLCKVMGWLTHLTYLSAFTWLTTLNFDLWVRFSRPLRCTRMMRPQDTKWKRFLAFASFSIGVPIMISGISIILDTVDDGQLLTQLPLPRFGKKKCYFENREALVLYLYGPAGVLLLIDLMFFASTVFHLRRIHAHTELARTQSTMEDRKGLLVFARLFLVMGLLWIFELASWIANFLFPENEIAIIWIFLPAHLVNSLQGVVIFYILVCKPKVQSQLLSVLRKDDPARTWNKQIVAATPTVTVQIHQPCTQSDYIMEEK